VSKTTRHLIENPGRLRRVSAAILVNDRLIQPASKGKSAQWQARSTEELRNLTSLAQAAVGFQPSRGDIVTVQNLPFEDNHNQVVPSLGAQILSRVETSPELLKYVSMLVGVLIVVGLGIRPALRRALVDFTPALHQLGEGSPALTEAKPATSEAILPDPNRAKAQEIFQQVTNQMKSEPAQSSRLLQSWIHSD